MAEHQDAQSPRWTSRLFDYFASENLDPADPLVGILTPGIMPEHMARYMFARQWVEELSTHGRPLTVVDAASGRGYGSAKLKEILPPDTNVIGVELGANYVRKAVQKYNPSNNKDRFTFLQGDVRYLPLADDSADLVTAYEITEHLPKNDQQGFIKEIVRILRPQGLALISIPYRYSFTENEKGEIVRVESGSNKSHLYEPTDKEMEEMIQKSGGEMIGRYGQAIVNKTQVEFVQKISQFFPAMGFYAWVVPHDLSVQPMPPDPKKVALTQLFVVKKS